MVRCRRRRPAVAGCDSRGWGDRRAARPQPMWLALQQGDDIQKTAKRDRPDRGVCHRDGGKHPDSLSRDREEVHRWTDGGSRCGHPHRGIFSRGQREILTPATTRMNPKDMTLSEVSQTEKDKHRVTPLLQGLQGRHIHRGRGWGGGARGGGSGGGECSVGTGLQGGRRNVLETDGGEGCTTV